MKSGIIALLSTWVCLWFGFAYAENNATLRTTVQADAIPQRGTLYRVQHQNNTTYLFGTIHVGQPAFFPLEAEMTRVLTRASKLVLEIDLRRTDSFQHALQKYGMYADGDSIEQHISADSLMQLQQVLQGFDLSLTQVKRMKPWLVTNMLIGLDLEQHGYQRSHGIEVFLLSLADRQAKAVQELESAEYQMSLFDSMSDTMQEQYLRENLAELISGSARQKAHALIEAWAHANSDALEAMMRDWQQEKTLSSEFTYRVLLEKRNLEMASKIEALLRNDASTFVGIGFLHMVGETGVPSLLRQRGYKVEKLY